MTTPSVIVERVGPVAVVSIDRPERRNAVDGPTATALETSLRELDADGGVRAIVLTGAGGTFCAGADLHALAGPDANVLTRDAHGPMGPTRWAPRTPVVAAVEGFAVAGGMELALWCDMRVVARDAVFGVFCRRWGVPLIDGGTVRLPRIVGQGVALDLVLTGREVLAEEALRIGLANRIVPSGTARDAAVALAHELAAFPHACMVADLVSTRAAFDLPVEAALLAEHDRGTASITASTDEDGMAAGVERFRRGAGRHGAPGAHRGRDGDDPDRTAATS